MMGKWLAYYDEVRGAIHAIPYSPREADKHGYIGVGEDKDDAVRRLEEKMQYEAAYLQYEADRRAEVEFRGLFDG
jgi:hypothetical protein